MPNYVVTVTRTEIRTLEVEVNAPSKEKAEAKCLAGAGDLDFPSAPSADYAVEGVVEDDE